MFKFLYMLSTTTVLLLTISITIQAVHVKSLLMVHPQSKKSVQLFHDVHARYLQMNADAQQRKLLSEIYENQKKSLTPFIDTLLNANPLEDTQTIVITETNANSLGRLVEQEVGAIQAKDSEETLEIFPRLFLRKLLALGSTVDAKLELFKQSIQPFNNVHTASFVLNNKLRWIAGDRNRTEHDAHLSFTVYKQWNNILKAIESKGQLPEELANLSIDSVKEYIHILHTQFQKNNIADPYHQKILDLIDKVLATQHVKGSDHLAYLHKYLSENNKDDARDEFNNNMIACISQKFDCELLTYLNEFEKDPKLNTALVFAGSEHCDQLRNTLLEKGYIITNSSSLYPLE